MNIVKNIRSNSETAADIRSDLGTAPAGRTTRRMDFNPETLSLENKGRVTDVILLHKCTDWWLLVNLGYLIN